MRTFLSGRLGSTKVSKRMGLSGLEPPTLRLSVVRSSQLSYRPVFGGDKRDRTADLLLARQALSQLSYTPISSLPRMQELHPLN